MYNIGIDFGGTKVAVGLVDENYNLIKKLSMRTNPERPTEEIIKEMAELCKTLLEECNVKISDVISVGMGLPGAVDRKNGIFTYAPNVNVLNFPIVDVFKKYFPIDCVYIENDANAAALGEAVAGAAKGADDVILITLGTGIGGGIIIGGKIYSGYNGAAGELGHMVIEEGGTKCGCGRHGCFEAYCSATALIRMTKEKMLEDKNSKMYDFCNGDINRANGRTSFDAMRAGDKSAKEVVDTYINYLANGVISLINIFQPEVFVIGGGISNERENLLIPLCERVRKEQYGCTLDRMTEIKIATLQNDAGIVGAAAIKERLHGNNTMLD